MPYSAFARTYDARMNDFVCPTLSDIRLAAARIAPYAVVTPVLRNDILDEAGGASVYFKCERLQRGGAFKSRGACNAVWALPSVEAKRRVVTHSSGNHRQGSLRGQRRLALLQQHCRADALRLDVAPDLRLVYVARAIT